MKSGDWVIVHERPNGAWSPSPEDHNHADYDKPPLAEFPILQSHDAILNEAAERVRIADELGQLSGREMTFGELEAIVAIILRSSNFEKFTHMSPQTVAQRIAELAWSPGALE